MITTITSTSRTLLPVRRARRISLHTCTITGELISHVPAPPAIKKLPKTQKLFILSFEPDNVPVGGLVATVKS